MKSLGKIRKQYGLPVQSHLSESREEIEWVKALCPKSEHYAGAYADFGLLGNGLPAVMAHCVWLSESEISLLAREGVYIAHCPQSNINLSSGIAPVRRLMERGVPVGLGSDVAGGVHSSLFRAMSDAIQVSKLRRSLIAPDEKALTLEEAFYLGSAGGGSFFGERRSGSFEPGWEFDALVIDDSGIGNTAGLGIRDRLERVVYLSDERHIAGKYVRGLGIHLNQVAA
jgi:guanine deaminase